MAARQAVGAYKETEQLLRDDLVRLRAEVAAAHAIEAQVRASVARKKEELKHLQERVAAREKPRRKRASCDGSGGGRKKKQRRAPEDDDLNAADPMSLRSMLHGKLTSAVVVTGANARALYVEATTLAAALSDCENSLRFAAARTTKIFEYLADHAKPWFEKEHLKLKVFRGDVSVADLVQLAKQKFSEEHFKMIAFVLYVNYLLDRYKFKWDNIQFPDWERFDALACSAKKKDHRILLGLQSLNLPGITGNSVDLADDPDCMSPLHDAMTMPKHDPGDDNLWTCEYLHYMS